MHVDGVGGQLEGVPAAAHHDQVRRPERVAQLRRERLKAVAHTRRRVFAPQRVDDLLGRDDPAGVHREQRKQRLLLACRDGHAPIVRITDFESAEEPDPHGTDRTGCRSEQVSAE